MKNALAIIWLLFICKLGQSQIIQGSVIEENQAAKKLPLAGAIVGVLHSNNAVSTDDKGNFMLPNADARRDTLVVIAVGYKNDTVLPHGNKTITITLQPLELKEVDIHDKKATRIELAAGNTEVINSNDLVKAACCNLSESFENSASIDVNFTDAVSGAKEIRMLGLDGHYTQILTENMPGIRGLGQTFGLNYIPGPWMSSIQVNKGAGSVVNGYEAITGQINVEYQKPLTAALLFVNAYLNQDLRNELNLISAKAISGKWSTLTAMHGQYSALKIDGNHDGYLDNPLVKQLDLMNRFSYQSTLFNFWSVVSANLENRVGGEANFNPRLNVFDQPYWGLLLTTERLDAFFKTAFTLPFNNFIGVQYQYIFQHEDGDIGRRVYAGLEHFGYVNFIYQKSFDKNDDLLKLGASFEGDEVNEHLDTFFRNRTELVPGVFSEASLNFGKDKKVMLVAGLRVDEHNLYGPFITPRANLKWKIVNNLDLRLSGGRGYRVPTIFAENFGLLASNRQIVIDSNLKYEEAWNYGASLTYKFYLNYRQGSFTVDYYRTDFVHQVIADIENTRLLQFYNLQGKSFANALQAEVAYEILDGFDIKLAYKYEPAKTDYLGGLKLIPLRPVNRGLVSLQYKTKNNHWRFNTGLNWYGKTRIPDTALNEPENQRPAWSPNWFELNAQVTFIWKQWEVYAGAENMLNFVQANPIIDGGSPFSSQFDASLIWGPLRGAMAFTGFRFTLK